jgi:pimeloyl-ACP methyl ester carboxylesterase
MQANIVLVTGPMVGASSWAPTADRLRASGARVQVPDVLALLGYAPPWSAWTSYLADLISLAEEPILVGHSLASTLVADLATKMPVRGVIIVDGDMPPANGPALPGKATFRDYVKSLADENGVLPPWSRWQRDQRRAQLVGIETLALDPDAFESFEKGLPRIMARWFDDVIDLAPWDHVPAGYIQTSAIYDQDAEEALRRGWPVKRMQGTHLHPTLKPDETVSAIEEICRELA